MKLCHVETAFYEEWANSVLGITGQASRWPQRIRISLDVAVRRRQDRWKAITSRRKGKNVTAGTDYPHLPLSGLFQLCVCVCVCVCV